METFCRKSYPQGVYPLTESTWARTCLDCGNGMNLHLDNINPFCKCRQDGIRLSPDPQESARSLRAKSARNPASRSHSRLSPRPPSASGIQRQRSANQGFDNMPNHLDTSKKVLLRYTDAGIQRPITPHLYTGPNSLPRLVRIYWSTGRTIP
ncbi:hypothetical protein MAR_011482 [Mya arenaria]|uniref:Uncharacterized protein n=1 Tax=Mya arenaria TaxID=6604 RepID=A0ABY7FY13_MYAAR|nr:hypothetical protein MAR_011482 [Mya arenaria]